MFIKLKDEIKKIVKKPIFLLFIVLLFSFLLRIPSVSSGLPFFHHEDEAHHFNRTVNMVKEGRFNPKYFLKPSLHFYLRMPVVAASFLWSVGKGEIKSIQDIRTEDKYGLAGYSFTASHPRIVKWNRGLSVLLILISIFIVYKITFEISYSKWMALTSALLAGISPELIKYGYIIGVDVPMTFFCLLSTLFALKLFKNFSYPNLIALAGFCGLAVSSKYNALPIMLLPLLVCLLLKRFSFGYIFWSVVTPVIAFVLGSPYVVLDLPRFLDHFAYEIWHYGIEGHAGNSSEPGIAQVVYYIDWLGKSAIGWLAFFTAIVGALSFLYRDRKRAVILLFFPVLFFTLMCSQKVNFVRNMIVIIPYFAIFAGFGTMFVVDCLRVASAPLKKTITILSVLALCLQPFLFSFSKALETSLAIDSRSLAYDWINDSIFHGDIAVAGTLQMPIFTKTVKGNTRYTKKGITRYDPKEFDLLQLYQEGYNTVVIGPKVNVQPEANKFLKLVKIFPGQSEIKRVVKNPQISFFQFENKALLNKEIISNSELSKIKFDISRNESNISFGTCEQEKNVNNLCWANSKINELKIGKRKTVNLKAITPWKNQKLRFFNLQNWEQIQNLDQNLLTTITLNIPEESLRVFVEIKEIHSPLTQELSEDSRRLGVSFN